MKAFDVDWRAVFDALPDWESLSVDARAAVLAHLPPTAPVSPPPFGAHLDALRRAGFVESMPTGGRVRTPEPRRDAVRVLRAMGRRRILDAPTVPALIGYIEEHFASDEVQGLGGFGVYGGPVGRVSVAARAGSVDWVDGFLACRTAAQRQAWVQDHGAPRLSDTSPLAAPAVFAAAQALVRELLAHPQGVPLAALIAARPAGDRAALGTALHAALRHLLVFAALRERDLLPVVGVWPPAAAYLARGEAPAPAPVEPDERFATAFLLEDMTTVLAAAAAEPLRLRGQDREIFARTQRDIEARLLELPAWVVTALRLDPGQRVPFAVDMLAQLGYVSAKGAPGSSLCLAASAAGARWLEQSDHDRLAAAVDLLRKSKQRNPPSWYDVGDDLAFFPVRFGYPIDTRTLDLRKAITRALLALPRDTFVPLAPFIQHQQETANPLLGAPAHVLRPIAQPGMPSGREALERLWGDLITLMLAVRLVPLGAVALGRVADGSVAIALTDVGRYLLGDAAAFAYGDAAVDEGAMVVQPNFDVVFLGAAPRLEARIARVAERVGRTPGIAFRLTRASVLAAAEAGTTAEQLLALLAQGSSKPLPGNVTRQLQAWYAAVRRVAVRTALLVDCPDAETALRARAAVGKTARLLGDTVLEVEGTDARARAALVRRLRAGGIFVQE